MRTKQIFLAAIIGLASLSAFGQSNTVYSVNAVGFINLSVPPGYSMIANQLDATNNTLAGLFPSLPDGTTIYKFNNGTGSYEIYTYDLGWTPNGNATLSPGEGAFIRNVASTNLPLTLVGELRQGSLTNGLPTGFSIKSSIVPQAGAINSVLGLTTPNDGDTVYQFNNGSNSYVINSYDFGSWSPVTPSIAVGESFFYRRIGSSGNWVRNFSVNN